ncbi:MAG TPA: EAL domain-containing protein [Candidatus Limnocylindrales bacterium]|nr:EAL domain-containing protein [Candidatus Limnocylindrales bacterium]
MPAFQNDSPARPTAVVGRGQLEGALRQRGSVLETRLDAYRRERTALAEALGATRSGETAEATARAIATTLLDLSGFGGVGLFDFVTSGEIVVLAALDRDGRPIELPGSLPTERSAYLRERASRGPWIEDWRPAPNHPYRDAAAELGIDVLAYVPIRSAHDVLGLLVVSGGPGGELDLTERLPALVETAAFAGALLGPQLRSRSAGAVCEARIRAIIADRAFLPVFQPIVDLATRVVVGYEALTRFADGSRPDEVFAAAARCNLDVELEAATLAAILDASAPLPATAWLNLNVSPQLVLAGEPLASLLARWGWQIVLELTEHIAVSDYAALRAALERLGPNVRLAVDDAGAGFASLRHILELRPDYVKLDRGIVRQIHRDPARQALVAGLVHFAAKTDATLVAEGVETEAEARQLQRLGVVLAQGYRLGRPVLADRIAPSPVTAMSAIGSRPGRPRSRPATDRPARDDIGRAVNVGSTLGAGLRAVGVATVAELRSLGAIPAWERLRRTQPQLATAATLLQLEGATRGITVSQLSPAERARHRLFVRLGRKAS